MLRKDEKDYVQVSAAFNADLIWKPEPEEEPAPQADGQTEPKAQDKKDPAKPEQPKIKSEPEIKAEIEALNKRVAEWVYVIPKFRAEAILKKPQDLLKISDS